MHFSWRLRHLPFSLPHIYPKTPMTSCEIEHKLWYHSLTQYANSNLLFSHLPCYSFVAPVPFHNSFRNCKFQTGCVWAQTAKIKQTTPWEFFPKNVVGRFAPFCLSSPCAFKKMCVNKFWNKIFFRLFRLPDRTGVHDQHRYWRHLATGANATTLPEYFKTHGYDTVSVGKVSVYLYNHKINSSNCNLQIRKLAVKVHNNVVHLTSNFPRKITTYFSPLSDLLAGHEFLCKIWCRSSTLATEMTGPTAGPAHPTIRPPKTIKTTLTALLTNRATFSVPSMSGTLSSLLRDMLQAVTRLFLG